MPTKLIDLSMPVDNGMVTFPKIVQPTLVMYQTGRGTPKQIGATEFGVDWLTATYRVELSDHVGTHMDSLRHMRDDAPGPGGDSARVLLWRRRRPRLPAQASRRGDHAPRKSRRRSPSIAYTLKPLDIVLIMTGAGSYQDEQRYLTDHPGLTADAVHWLLDQGIVMMGIDAITLRPPGLGHVRAQAVLGSPPGDARARVVPPREPDESRPASRNPSGSSSRVFPIKWVNTTGAPVRAVAIIEE